MNAEAQDISSEDRQALARLGHPVLPELLTELISFARRGRDLAVLAGAGSGKEALYALAAAERCRPDSGEVQALVLTPTRESAGRASRFAYELAGPHGIHALAWSPEFSGSDEARDRPVAQLVAGRPDELMEEIRAGRLGIQELELLVLDGISALVGTGSAEAAEEILDTAGGETQVIAVSDRADEAFTRIAERQLERPRRWPGELLDDEPPEPRGPALIWATAPGFEERVDLLARGLLAATSDEPTEVVVHCGDEASAHSVAAALSTRGFHIASAASEPGVGVAWGEEEEPEGGVAAWFGLPSGLPGLRRTAATAASRLAVVRPEEAAQLRLLARRAGWPLEPVPGRIPEAARRSVDGFREVVADRIGAGQAELELLVLEPLLEAHGFPEVTAALSGWLRELWADGESGVPSPAAGAEADGPGGGTPSTTSGSPSRKSREDRGDRPRRRKKPGPTPPWTSLFVPVGERDGVRPGDLVGAITGETDAVGGQIGKIEIRDSYSLVDVETGIADHVIEELSGAAIRGRRVEVRRDRES